MAAESLNTLLNTLSTAETSLVDTSYTHVTEFGPNKKWIIKQQNYEQLWRGYCDLAYNNDEMLCLSERSADIMPLMISMKLCFDAESVDYSDFNLNYSENFVATLVLLAQQVIIETYQITDDERELICCVLESMSSWIEVDVNEHKKLCSRIRLQFPYCRVEPVVINQIIYPRFILLCRQENIFKLLQSQPSNDWSEIIDLNFFSKPVLLLNSKYSQYEQRLSLSYIYPKLNADEIANNNLDNLRLGVVDAFHYSKHQHVAQGFIDESMFDDDVDEDYWMPFYLSVYYGNGITKIKEKAPTITLKPRNARVSEDECNEVMMSKIFLEMISEKRKSTKIYWLDIGKALYEIYDGSDEGLNEWVDMTHNLSNPEESVDPDICEREWATFSSCVGLTIKTLAWYARTDNPEEYKRWHDKWIYQVLIKSTAGLHTDVAVALYRCYWLEFAFVASGKSGIWYRYRKHRWVKNEMGTDIRRITSDDFVRRYEELRAKLSRDVATTTDDTTKLRLEGYIKDITKLIGNLKKTGYKSNIFKEAQLQFEIKDFTSYLDQNPYCICHLNGVTEVDDDQVIFRDGKPEDYISKNTLVKWERNLNWESPQVKAAMDWFGKVFVDPDLKETFLKYGASWFYGGNPDKLVPCFTGEGDNSKSLIVKAFEAVWGQYCFKVPNSLFTATQKSSGSANPELAQANGARGGFSDELEEDEVLRTGLLKKISGGDSFFARFLHDNGGKVKVTFKFVVVCNKIPRMNSVHQSIKNRFLIIPFMSKFTNDASDNIEVQYKEKKFKRDPFFENQIPKLAPAILWIFSKYFGQYKREGLNTPQVVKEACEDYWKDVDIYEMFKDECITLAWKDKTKGVRDNDARVTTGDLHREFKQWFKTKYEGEKVPTIRDFKGEMSKQFGQKPLEGKYWLGIALATQEAIDESKFGGRSTGATDLKKNIPVM